MIINHKTYLNMLIGHPLEHSQSPLLHNTVYQTANINAVLLGFANEDLDALIRNIRTLSVGLTAVTMPFKQEVVKYLDHCSPEVEALQAANTIIQTENKLMGHNTDVAGIAYTLRNTKISGKNILIIGAGGAARALAYFLQDKGPRLLWMNRTLEKVFVLADLFGGEVLNPDQMTAAKIDIIVNTTPLGMYPNIQTTPLPNYTFSPEQTVFDMVYNPIETALLKQATFSGAKVLSGLSMFIQQGLRQIELWTNQPFTTEKMRKLINKTLIRHLNNSIS